MLTRVVVEARPSFVSDMVEKSVVQEDPLLFPADDDAEVVCAPLAGLEFAGPAPTCKVHYNQRGAKS